MWRPNLRPYRLGVAFRSPINTKPNFSRNLLPTPDGDILIGAGDDSLGGGSGWAFPASSQARLCRIAG